MESVINILIITADIERGYKSTDLYPIAFKTTVEAENELLSEGFTKTNRLHEFNWIEENICKTALLRYTTVALNKYFKGDGKMNMHGNKNFEELERLLSQGKKVTTKDKILRFKEDFNNKDSGYWSSEKVKHTEIEYIYVNTQFNRMFAHLIDGRDVDYDITFMNIFWNTFVEQPESESKEKMAVKDIEKILGYKIEIIN